MYGEQGYLMVNPDFHAIFTSNPEEYTGTHQTQDALIDRFITIQLDPFERETEIEITMSKSSVPRPDAERVVDIVREIRQLGLCGHRSTMRACISIAVILVRSKARSEWDDPVFRWACHDVLNTFSAQLNPEGNRLRQQKVDKVIDRVCGRRSKCRGARRRTSPKARA